MDDAIWADDLDSDDDGDGVDVEGDDDGEVPEHGSSMDEGSTTGTRSAGYGKETRTSDDDQSDGDLDDSTSAVSDDPPTGRGRRSVRRESMTRYWHERLTPLHCAQLKMLVLKNVIVEIPTDCLTN